MLEEAKFVVCCDGAANEYISRGHTPDVIIGDGDSFHRNIRNCCSYHPPDSRPRDERPDQSCPVSAKERLSEDCHCRSHRQTGRSYIRKYQSTHRLYEREPGIRTITDYGVLCPASGTQTFESHPGQQVSIINFGAKGLKGEGLVYPLSDFSNWWQGTLNEATANQFTIHCIGEYLVYLAH